METLPALISSLFTVKPHSDDSVDDNLIFISYNKKDGEIAKQVAVGRLYD